MSPSAAVPGAPTRVLHVDPDSEAVAHLAEALDRRAGAYEVVGEPDPAEALERLDGTGPDCVVTEHDLPGTDGLAFLEAIRERRPSLPVVLFTGAGNETVASRAIAAGVTDYVPKGSLPGGVDSLAERIDNAIDGRAERAADADDWSVKSADDADDGRSDPSGTAARYNSEQLEQFLQAFPDAVFVVSEDGRHLDVIAGGDRSLPYDEMEALLGERFHDVLPAGTADRLLDTVQRALETGDQQRIEYHLEVDGSRQWFEARVGPLDTRSTARTAFWIARDITVRKRREREYEQFFDKVTDAIAVFDPDSGDIIDVNDAYRAMVGYDDLARIRDLGIEGLSASDEGYTGERGRQLISDVSETGEPEAVQWRLETGDGERRWLEVTLTPAEVGGQQRVLSIQRDVTERRELERTYRNIFENVSDGLVVHDPDTGEILEVNEQYCELTGYDREELLDGTVSLVIPEDSEYTYEEVLERITEAREEGPQLFEFEGERKNGGVFVGEVNLRTIQIRGEERVLASVRDITERKRREQEYEQIFNNVNDIIAVRDPETGEIVDANQAYADLLGYDREEMQEMGIEDVGVPEDGYDETRGMEHLRASLSSDEPVEFEWKVRDAEGRSHLMDVRATAAVINGEHRYLAIGRDVTDRKRRERAVRTLQDATERLQAATTPGEVAAIAVETASDILRSPMAVCWFYDGDPDRLRPAASTDAVSDAGSPSTLSPGSHEYDAFRRGEVTSYGPGEHSSTLGEGASANPIEAGVVLPLADHGLIAVGPRPHHERPVDETILDVERALADHVTTALDRVERDQAVRESERRFRLIADRIDEVIYLAELDFSEVLYVNPAYEATWGRSVENLYSDPREFIEAVDPRDRADFEAHFEEMVAEMDAGEAKDRYEFEYRIRQPDGELRWVTANGYAVEFPGGTRRFVGVVEDTTERKRREQRLEVFNRILRHNLRNQLDVIRSHAEVLADRTDGDHACRIAAAVDELAAIGAEARETDRIMSMDGAATEVSLSGTLRETIDAAEPARDDVAIRTQFPADATVTTNRTAVEIAVESALENAIEYADSTVTVAVENHGDECVVLIDDDGPGIPEEELVPIETGTETNLRHGRGLGLWQLRWSVDRLNGQLSFDTTDGTTVRITIPDREPPE